MISSAQLEEWKEQHQKDMQQYRKDELHLQDIKDPEDNQVRSFFERVSCSSYSSGPSTSTSRPMNIKN